MRAIICTDFVEHLRKLIWITEYETGVSVGMYDSHANPHATYHMDGSYHCKITAKNHPLKFASEKKPPIAEITAEEPLLGMATFYVEDIMNRLPLYTPDDRADSTVFLGQSVFSNIRVAAFNAYIIHRNHEITFLEKVYPKYDNEAFMLVTVNLFGLDLFPDHKVGLLVYKGRESPTEKRRIPSDE